ncbi:MAG: hypothetical protein L0Y55_13360 [Anaerolineales bacterium]|nr:hypothetical protein [Anaerolineales bacterium]
MKNIFAILILPIALTACASRVPTIPSPVSVSQDRQSPAATTRLREPSANQTPQARRASKQNDGANADEKSAR